MDTAAASQPPVPPRGGRAMAWIMVAATLMVGSFVLWRQDRFLATVGSMSGFVLPFIDTCTSSFGRAHETAGEDPPFFRMDGETLLAFAMARPEAPRYLWLWWRDDGLSGRHRWPDAPHDWPRSEGGRVGFTGEPAMPAPTTPEEIEREYQRLNDDSRLLWERDPENGWSLLVKAAIEAWRGIGLNHAHYPPVEGEEPGEDGGDDDPWPYRVAEPEHAAEAARLLHGAVRRARFTQDTDDLYREELALMGEPRSLAGLFSVLLQFARQRSGGFGLARDFSRRMAAEAARRLDDDATAAEGAAILFDTQTLGARIQADETMLVGVLAGSNIVYAATEQGVPLLEAAGRPDEAARLLERGVRLVRPALIRQRYRERVRKPPTALGWRTSPTRRRMLEHPSVAAEAERLAVEFPTPPESIHGAEHDKEAGFLASLLLPGLERAVPPGLLTVRPEERVAARQAEFFGVLRLLLCGPLLWALWIGMIFLTVASAVQYGFWRWRGSGARHPGDPVAAFAGPGWYAAVAVGIFLLIGVFPVAAAELWSAWGSFSMSGPAGYLAVGLTLYTAFIAAVCLLEWKAWAYRRPAAGADDNDAAFGRRLREKWIVVAIAMLLGALVIAVSAFCLTDSEATTGTLSDTVKFVLVPGMTILFTLGGALLGLWGSRAFGESALLRGLWRRFLPGLASGVLLWMLLVPAWAERRETYWRGRDTLLTPRVADPLVAFTALEGRIVLPLREDALAALAEFPAD